MQESPTRHDATPTLAPRDLEHLSQVNDTMAQLRWRIVQQKRVIRRLKAAGEPLEVALDFLAGMEAGLEALRSHRRYFLGRHDLS